MKITFLHTSNSHITRFEKIVKEIDENITVEHFVNEALLDTALKTGKIDAVGFNNEIEKIKNGKYGKIICTCSTYGELCDEKEVFRIDRPIAEKIVADFSKIGLAFTVNTTKENSKELLKKVAKEQDKQIKIKEIDCQDCWKWFEKGDLEKYSSEIAYQIKQKGNDCEVIFLAQASMEGANKYLVNEKYKTVSSPIFGVEKFVKSIENGGNA